ncbi:MAG TPA: surface-adhesin E family protein [Nitrospiraceae bacterium]|nr:surface-adhesin E family protein [Nitrospiraceae bacterium]
MALSSGPAYAEWVFVSGDDEAGMTVYVDPDTIRRQGDFVKMWHLSNRKTTEGYGSIKTQREYDCAEARHRLLAASIFSGHMGQGKLLEDNVKEGLWMPVAPGSSGHALWKVACGKK